MKSILVDAVSAILFGSLVAMWIFALVILARHAFGPPKGKGK